MLILPQSSLNFFIRDFIKSQSSQSFINNQLCELCVYYPESRTKNFACFAVKIFAVKIFIDLRTKNLKQKKPET
jgi:hypothetical protein